MGNALFRKGLDEGRGLLGHGHRPGRFLDPDLVGEIFEPFVSSRENGTGLGLALVSKIISDHDGWISLDSVPGRTVFRISLPLAPKDFDTGEI